MLTKTRSYEQLKMEKQNWPAWKRVYHFLF